MSFHLCLVEVICGSHTHCYVMLRLSKAHDHKDQLSSPSRLHVLIMKSKESQALVRGTIHCVDEGKTETETFSC